MFGVVYVGVNVAAAHGERVLCPTIRGETPQAQPHWVRDAPGPRTLVSGAVWVLSAVVGAGPTATPSVLLGNVTCVGVMFRRLA